MYSFLGWRFEYHRRPYVFFRSWVRIGLGVRLGSVLIMISRISCSTKLVLLLIQSKIYIYRILTFPVINSMFFKTYALSGTNNFSVNKPKCTDFSLKLDFRTLLHNTSCNNTNGRAVHYNNTCLSSILFISVSFISFRRLFANTTEMTSLTITWAIALTTRDPLIHDRDAQNE